MPSHTKREDLFPDDVPRWEATTGWKRKGRRTARIVPLIAAILCALAVFASGCSGNGGQPKPDAANTAQTASSDQASEEAKKKEEAEKAAAEKAAAEKAEAEHKALRDEAVANGEQVFEGTIFLGNGAEVANMLGTTRKLNAFTSSDREAIEKTTYAMLALDSPQSVYITGYSNGPVTRDYAYINLGINSFNQYNNSYEDMGYSKWEQYGGKRVCVAVSKCGLAEDMNIMNQPNARIENRLLYVVDDSAASSASTADAQANSTSTQPTAQPAMSEKDKAIAEARNAGYRVAGGTVQIMTLTDFCALMGYSGGPAVASMGDSVRAAVLSLDDESKADLGYDTLVLGSEFGIGGPVDPWTQYDGKHVVVSATGIDTPSGQITADTLMNPEVIYEG